jgi:biotin carboxyl carrier protein
MKYFLFILVILIPYNLVAQNNIEDKLKTLETILYNLDQELKVKEKKLTKIKQTYLLSLIKSNLIKENMIFIDEENRYYDNIEKYELLIKVHKNILKILENEIKRLQDQKIQYRRKLEENKKLKETYHQEKVKEAFNTEKKVLNEHHIKTNSDDIQKTSFLFDPITEKSISTGKFKRHVQPGTPIKAPISGIVKKISFLNNSLTLTLENKQCFAFISGFSIIKVNLGEEVRAKQVLGEASYSEEAENLYFEIFCK